MTHDLKYDNPKDLSIQKMHEIVYGIEWWNDKKNQETYLAEQKKLQTKQTKENNHDKK